MVVFFTAFGFLRFRQEKNPLKLWVPPDTTFIRDSEWLMSTFQRGFTEEAIMVIADDVLTPETIGKVNMLCIIISYTFHVPYIVLVGRSSSGFDVHNYSRFII